MMKEDFMTGLLIGCVFVYFFIGVSVMNMTYQSYRGLKNPLWKPLVVLFWPIYSVVSVVRLILRWVDDVKRYYYIQNSEKDRREK